jgi:regulator of replication initiation timing
VKGDADAMLDPEGLKDQLQKALRECASLKDENERLKKLLGLYREDRPPTFKPIVSEPSAAYTSANQVTNDSPIETQVAGLRLRRHSRPNANADVQKTR